MFGFGRCFACGSSVIGPSHLLHGIVNQDAFLFKKRRKYSLFVVSDGMGSKPFSDIGSKMACESVSREIERFVKNLHERVSVSRLTTAKVNSEVTVTGISRCHYKDKFDKLTGKKIAYNNAITKLYDLSLITAEDRIDLAAFDLVSADFVAPQLNTCEQEAKI